MTAPIISVFKNRTIARAAAKDLLARGFATGSVEVIAKPSRKSAIAISLADPVVQAIIAAGVHMNPAQDYAERVYQGESLVVVRPPFGIAVSAADVLQQRNPIEVTVPQVESTHTPRTSGIDWTSPTPLSSWLGWRVLLDNPAPLSTWLNKATLKPEPASSPTLDSIRRQSAEPTPLSSKFGWRLLSDNPSPLSSKFGWDLLKNSPTPLSDKFGWKVTSDDPTPLSSRFGWPLLSKKTA